MEMVGQKNPKIRVRSLSIPLNSQRTLLANVDPPLLIKLPANEDPAQSLILMFHWVVVGNGLMICLHGRVSSTQSKPRREDAVGSFSALDWMLSKLVMPRLLSTCPFLMVLVASMIRSSTRPCLD